MQVTAAERACLERIRIVTQTGASWETAKL